MGEYGPYVGGLLTLLTFIMVLIMFIKDLGI